MRGGNRIFRKAHTKKQIEGFVERYKKQNNKLWSPITKKNYADYKKWHCSITYNLDKPAANYFFFLLQPVHYSKYSGIQLSEKEYSYSETYKGWTGFLKYTLKEREQGVWRKIADRSALSTPEAKKLNSQRMKAFYQTEKGLQTKIKKSRSMLKFYNSQKGIRQKQVSAAKQSKTMRYKIQNGCFTPPITNTWTHWNAKIILRDGQIRQFRSSWEACFFYSNQHLEYETIRIKRDNRVVICDFFDKQTKTVYEIKPRSRYNIEIDKILTIQKFCFENSFTFKWINENNILNFINVKQLQSDQNNNEQFLKLLKNTTIKKQYNAKHNKD